MTTSDNEGAAEASVESDDRVGTNRMRFRGFLCTLELGLQVFARRLSAAEAAPDDRRSPVSFRPSARTGARDEVLIGLGWPGADAGETDWICLNNKAVQPRYPSVTDLVLAADAVVVERWQTLVADDARPERFFERFTVVVEDASPDSVVALIWFLARLNGVSRDELPARWSQFVHRWELGYVQAMGAAEDCYGALESALVHRRFGTKWGNALLDGLRFTVAALESGAPPEDLSAMPPSDELAVARAFLRYEEQAYRDRLRHATLVQLLMPMADAPGRSQLVDACLTEEPVPLGAFKVFARTDRRHPYLENGFPVMAIYKSDPETEGSGNDLSVSVAKEAGLDLAALWHELEDLEWRAWGAERPCDDPRKDIRGYPDGQPRADGRPAPNQPWYDGGDYTLIAAPKRLPDGRLGTKLSWTDLCEAVWSVYQPFRCVGVRPGADAAVRRDAAAGDALVSLHACPEHPVSIVLAQRGGEMRPRQRLLVAGWATPAQARRHRTDDPQPWEPLRATPTLGRYLAACLERGATAEGPIRLADLPEDAAYDIVEFASGIAVISEAGCFLLDAGRHQPLAIYDLIAEFEYVCRILEEANTAAERVAKLLTGIGSYVRGRRRPRTESNMLSQLAGLQLTIRTIRSETAALHASPERQRFRDALMQRWGIAGHLDQLHDGVGQVHELLHSHSELYANRRIAFLTVYGFPLVLAATFFDFVLQDLPKDAWPRWSDVHWRGVALYGLLAIAGVCTVLFASWLRDRVSRFTRSAD